MDQIMSMYEVKVALSGFDATKLTDAYVEKLKERERADQESKKQYAIAFFKYKNEGDKITDGVAKAKVDQDPDYISAETKRIEAEGAFTLARLQRDDYLEKNNNVKILAKLLESEMKINEPTR